MPSQKKYSIPKEDHQELNEPQADYEKAELDLLRDGIRSSYTERFEMMMKLIKVGIMLKNAKIIHKPELNI